MASPADAPSPRLDRGRAELRPHACRKSFGSPQPHRSSEALAALFALSLSNAKLHGRAVAAAEQALRSGSPALRARARKLLRKPEVRHVRSR